MAQMVKSLPVMPDTWVGSMRWEDPLEKGMAPHSSILVWRISWEEEPGGLQSMGVFYLAPHYLCSVCEYQVPILFSWLWAHCLSF